MAEMRHKIYSIHFIKKTLTISLKYMNIFENFIDIAIITFHLLNILLKLKGPDLENTIM